MDRYYVYLLSSATGTLHTGITNNLEQRLDELRLPEGKAYAGRFQAMNLVYYEALDNVLSASAREKQLRDWPHQKKVALIVERNPSWRDLGADLLEGKPSK